MWRPHGRTHARQSGYPEVFDFPGFRVALAIASLPGMTPELFNGFREHHTSWSRIFSTPRIRHDLV